MKLVKVFNHTTEEEVNEFLKKTDGKLIDIKYAATAIHITEENDYEMLKSRVVMMPWSCMVIYEINSPGGMQ